MEGEPRGAVESQGQLSSECVLLDWGEYKGTPLATGECGSRCSALHNLITSLKLFKEHIKYKLLSSSVAEKSEAQRVNELSQGHNQ